MKCFVGLCLALILSVSLVSPIFSKETVSGLKTKADFEASEFCRKYQCHVAKSWPLKTGGTNHSYDSNLNTSSHDVLVEATTKGELVTEIGLIFTNDDNSSLTDKEFGIIETLLKSLNPNGNHKAAFSFIRKHVEKEVSQINEAPSIKDGEFRIRAGKVLQQTILIERVKSR
jgi:hypothetical protein